MQGLVLTRWLMQWFVSKLGTVFEAFALLCIAVMLIQLYLISSNFVGWGWFVTVAVIAVFFFLLSLLASYYSFTEDKEKDEHKQYRINHQLIETLKTKEAMPDIVYGLEKLLRRKGPLPRYTETEFSDVLKNVFGPKRAGEVESILLMYAEAPPKPPDEMPKVNTETVGQSSDSNGTGAQTDNLPKTSPEVAATTD